MTYSKLDLETNFNEILYEKNILQIAFKKWKAKCEAFCLL